MEGEAVLISTYNKWVKQVILMYGALQQFQNTK